MYRYVKISQSLYLRGVLRQPRQTAPEKPIVPVHQVRRQRRSPETDGRQFLLGRVQRQFVVAVLAVRVERMARHAYAAPGLGRQIAVRQMVVNLLGRGHCEFPAVPFVTARRHFPQARVVTGHQQRFVFRYFGLHHHRVVGHRHFDDCRFQRPEQYPGDAATQRQPCPMKQQHFYTPIEIFDFFFFIDPPAFRLRL